MQLLICRSHFSHYNDTVQRAVAFRTSFLPQIKVRRALKTGNEPTRDALRGASAWVRKVTMAGMWLCPNYGSVMVTRCMSYRIIPVADTLYMYAVEARSPLNDPHHHLKGNTCMPTGRIELSTEELAQNTVLSWRIFLLTSETSTMTCLSTFFASDCICLCHNKGAALDGPETI